MSGTDFVPDSIESYRVKGENDSEYSLNKRSLVKIHQIVDNMRLGHSFIIRNKDGTKQKTIEHAPENLRIAYCTGWESFYGDPLYETSDYIHSANFNQKKLKAIYDNDGKALEPKIENGKQVLINGNPVRVKPDSKKANNHPMYLFYDQFLINLLAKKETQDVKNGGGARRKSKNAKRSRSKSRKSRKQRKSNKNRRTKYYKK
jgi:hypothetical protein